MQKFVYGAGMENLGNNMINYSQRGWKVVPGTMYHYPEGKGKTRYIVFGIVMEETEERLRKAAESAKLSAKSW